MVIASMVVLAAIVLLGGCGARGRGSASQSWSGVAVEGDSAFVGTKDGRIVQIRLLEGGTRARLGEQFVARKPDQGATDPAFYGTPAVDGGRLYVGGYHGVAYSMRAVPRAEGGGVLQGVGEFPIDGNPLAEGITGSLVPAGDVIVVAASEDAEAGRLYVLEADRFDQGLSELQVERCRYPAVNLDPIGQLWTTPTVVDGVAYFGDLSHRLYAVSIADCQLVWDAPVELGGAIVAPPVVIGDKLYLGAFDRVFYEVDRETRAVRPLMTADGWFWARAATDGRRLYAPSLDGTLHAYDTRDDTVLWTYQEGDPEPILSAPVVVGDKVVMASDSGTVTLLSATQGRGVRSGSPLDEVFMDDAVRAPLTARDDFVFVHSLDEVVTALRIDGERFVPEWDCKIDKESC